MSHINIKTGNLELPYIDKIYITEDIHTYLLTQVKLFILKIIN